MSIGGMKTMTVKTKTAVLIGVLEKNLEKHLAEFEKVTTGYAEAARKALAEKLNEFSDGKVPMLDFHRLQRPKCYADEYRRTIAMLKMHDDEHILLDSAAYMKFVEDQWDWKHSFSTLSASYGVGMALGLQL